jgi:diadenosine tetraphosphate (Ap4A) HIT family hydrolase
LREVVHDAGQRLAPDVERQLAGGFPNDDAFDSFVGLVSMLLVLLGHRPAECPDDPAIRQIEGWILGQEAPSAFLLRPESEWVASNRLAFAIRDGFPVSLGHTLIVPRRMVSTWFEATAAEKAAMVDLLEVVRRRLDEEHQPDGYNVGFNAGEAAGQTVRHLHLHVIPRYKGDVEDPRGGIRHVIPGKGNYLRPGPR